MPKLSANVLTGAMETLLIPLWARAAESTRPAPILVDSKALGIVEAIDYDFHRFERMGGKQAGYCVRALLVDNWVRQFLKDHPAGPVVDIGAGLDTRYERVDNGTVRWFDLDFPEVIQLRRSFFEETPRRTFLSFSALDPEWLTAVDTAPGEPVMFLAEGVFYFLSQQEVAELFTRLADRFPGSSIVFDSQSRLFLQYSRLTHPIRGNRLQASITDPREVETWDDRFRLEESIGFGDSPHYDAHFARLPLLFRWVRRTFPAAREMFRLNRVRLG